MHTRLIEIWYEWELIDLRFLRESLPSIRVDTMNSKPFSPILIPSNIYIRRHNPRSTIKIDVIELQNRDVYLWTRPCFERALSTAWKILTHHAGVSALEELGVSIVEHYGFPRGAPTTYQEVRNQTLVFLYGDTGDYKKGFRRGRFFPSFVVDDWLALGDDEQLGYFMRSHNYDLSDAKIALNSKVNSAPELDLLLGNEK